MRMRSQLSGLRGIHHDSTSNLRCGENSNTVALQSFRRGWSRRDSGIGQIKGLGNFGPCLAAQGLRFGPRWSEPSATYAPRSFRRGRGRSNGSHSLRRILPSLAARVLLLQCLGSLPPQLVCPLLHTGTTIHIHQSEGGGRDRDYPQK